MKRVVVTGGFDDVRARDFRFLEEASRLGSLHVLLWSDATFRLLEGALPRFTEAERMYMLEAVRYVDRLTMVTRPAARDALPQSSDTRLDVWVVDEADDNPQKQAYCEAHGIEYRVVSDRVVRCLPVPSPDVVGGQSSRKRVVVTGCFDWFHSGHVRFFEETSQLGDLYVVVGHDDNVRLLKGEGHPMFSQDERTYMVQSIRHVTQALVTSGHGWMDAEPEIARIKPDIYAVNEDGDKPEKRAFCAEHGLEYVVLRRTPKEGLPRRESTVLRGF